MKNASLEGSRRFVAILATIFVILSSGFPDRAEGQNATDAKVLTMRDRLEKTTIESVRFESATLESTLEYLSVRVEGLQFVILDDADGSGIANKPVTLSLRSVPAATILSYLCRLTGCQYEVERDAVMVGTGTDIAAVLTKRAARPQGKSASAAMKMLSSVKLESVDLTAVDVATGLQYIRQSVAKSTGGSAPNFVIVEHQTDSKVEPAASRIVSLKLKNVSASTAFGYLTDLSGLSYRLDGRAVVVGPSDQVAHPPSHRLAGGVAIQRQMAATQIAEVRFDGISLSDAIEGVRFYSRQGSSSALNVIDRAREFSDVSLVSLNLDRVSLADLVSYIAEQTGTRARLEQRALVFEEDPTLAQRARSQQEKEAAELAKSGGTGVVPIAPAPGATPANPAPAGENDQVSNSKKKPDSGLRFD
jgi:hypothetical protein